MYGMIFRNNIKKKGLMIFQKKIMKNYFLQLDSCSNNIQYQNCIVNIDQTIDYFLYVINISFDLVFS
jgi:hypothetical protein